MCRAQDRPFKAVSKVSLPLVVKTDRNRSGNIFKPRHHLQNQNSGSSGNTSPTGISALKRFFATPAATPTSASTSPNPPEDAAAATDSFVCLPEETKILLPDSAGMAKDSKTSREEDDHKLILKPRVLKKCLGDDISNCGSDVCMPQDEDMLLIKRALSFDEAREDDQYSLFWAGISPKREESNSDGSNGNLERPFEFMRDVPIGGIIQLPRSAMTLSTTSETWSATFSESDDITDCMSNLHMKPEPFKLFESKKDHNEADDGALCAGTSSSSSIYDTPPVTFPLYWDVPTPPTPKHVSNLACYFDNFPDEVPSQLLLPTFHR